MSIVNNAHVDKRFTDLFNNERNTGLSLLFFFKQSATMEINLIIKTYRWILRKYTRRVKRRGFKKIIKN